MSRFLLNFSRYIQTTINDNAVVVCLDIMCMMNSNVFFVPLFYYSYNQFKYKEKKMRILAFISISSVEIYAHIINVLFLLVVPHYYSIILYSNIN